MTERNAPLGSYCDQFNQLHKQLVASTRVLGRHYMVALLCLVVAFGLAASELPGPVISLWPVGLVAALILSITWLLARRALTGGLVGLASELWRYSKGTSSSQTDPIKTALERLGSHPNRELLGSAADCLVESYCEGATRLASLRTTAVLMGLFGTVTLFAHELGGAALAPGGATRWLAGALLSTLTGIACSIALGSVATHIESLREQLHALTREYFQGTVYALLSQPLDAAPITDQLAMWNALKNEVARLTQSLDVEARKQTTTGQELAAAARQVAELIDNSTKPTIKLEVEQLRETVAKVDESLATMNASLRGVLTGLSGLVKEVPGALAVRLQRQDATLSGLDARAEALATHGTALRMSADGIRAAAEDLSRASAKATASGTEEVLGRLDAVDRKVVEIAEVLNRKPPPPPRKPATQHTAESPPAEAAGKVPKDLQGPSAELQPLQDQVRQLQQVLQHLWEGQNRLDRLAQIIHRVLRAPLMRLLLLGSPK